MFSEKKRVYEFKQICDKSVRDEKLCDDHLENLGRLMNDSHNSCRDDFDCSCSELDELVQVARLGCVGFLRVRTSVSVVVIFTAKTNVEFVTRNISPRTRGVILVVDSFIQ